MQKIQLNENELIILKRLYKETVVCTGGQFGYLEDVSREGFTKHEFAGYIGSLTKKGVFEYLSYGENSNEDNFKCQFELIENINQIINLGG